MICPTCGTDNVAGARFCMECATPLAAACPNCGFANLPGAKFCSNCATPLSQAAAAQAPALRSVAVPAASPAPGVYPTPAETAAERRQVSILFADLVGFTPFAEERDAEEVRETLTRYFELAREIIGRYGGTVEKFIGDAVMAVWGAPTAQEDDAERAVRAALDLVAAVRSLGPTIQARAGVLTGEAAVTVGAVNQGMVAGDLVNTAARLQSVAEPGTVLVGEATQRAAGEAIVFEPAGEQTLKGKATPVPAWRALRVIAQRGGRGRADTLEAPFVGRDDELRLLKELFHATNRERRPRLVSVIGPAGIGKSRLAWEFLKYVDGLQETVWWHDGRSPAYGDGITFWALGEMVRERVGLLETDDEQTTRAKVAASITQHINDPGERETVESALLALLGFGSGVDAQQLFGAWRTFFERLADVRPVVMVFEDLHFADAGLLDFIEHVLEWSRHSAITIITLARPDLIERRATWGAGQRSFTSIYLEPLSAEQMSELLSGLVPGLPERASAAIVARADGVPMYAVETVRMLLADGRLTLDGGVYRPAGDLDNIAVPETLTALIAARLDTFSAADRSLIADAAVLGQTFSPAALAAIAGADQDSLEALLARLVRGELLRREVDPRSPERGQYAFVQALIREVAYNTLARRERKARHLSAARYFEALGSDELAGALAGHYLAAYRLAAEGAEADALASQARVALRAAAERAAALASQEQAVAFLDEALSTTNDPADRADLHERALRSAVFGVSDEVALRHADGALAARRQLDDRAATASAVAAKARVYRDMSRQPAMALELLLPAFDEFADLEDTPAGVALMTSIASAYAGLDQSSQAIPWVERVLPIAERLDLIDDLVEGLYIRGTRLGFTGRPREGSLIMRGAHGIAYAHRLHHREKIGRTLVTFFEQWDNPAAGLAMAREGLEIARQLGSGSYAYNMVGNGAICAIRTGEWDWAAALLEEWVSSNVPAASRSEFHVDRAILRSLRGQDASFDLDQATALRAGISDVQFESYDLWARAWADLSAGRLSQAFDNGLRAAERTSYFRPLAVPVAARAMLWSRDLARTQRAMQILGESTFRGEALTVDRLAIEAGMAALDGRTLDSMRLYREALRGWRNLGLAWDEALTALDMAILRDSSEVEVRVAADWARETLVRLEAKPYVERLDSALAKPVAPAKPAAAAQTSEVSAPVS